jgi:hypothetical protein
LQKLKGLRALLFSRTKTTALVNFIGVAHFNKIPLLIFYYVIVLASLKLKIRSILFCVSTSLR